MTQTEIKNASSLQPAMIKQFIPGQRLIEAINPAEGTMIPVIFVRWFNDSKTYARVRYESGRCLSVPANILIEA
jgi:hypothetical protein